MLFLIITFLFFSCTEKENKQKFPDRDSKTLIHNFSFNNQKSSPFIELTYHQNRLPDSLLVKCLIYTQKTTQTYLQLVLNKSPGSPQFHRSRVNATNQEEWVSLFAGTKFLAWKKNQKVQAFVQVMTQDPEVKIKECSLSEHWDNRFKNPIAPFFENYQFSKDKKKRIVFMGGSTAVDNGGENHFPFIFDLLINSLFPNYFDVVNLSSWGMSLLDHRYNIFNFEISDFGYPFFSNHVYKNFYDQPISPKHQEYGIKELQADLIVLAPVWNDFALPLFTLPKKLPYFESTPLTYLYGKNLVDLSLENERNNKEAESRMNLKMTSQILNLWTKPHGPENVLKKYPFITEKSYSEALYDHYRLGLELVIKDLRKALPHTPIMILTLPFGIYNKLTITDQILDQTKDVSLTFFIKDRKIFKSFWPLVDQIQRRVGTELLNPKDKIFFVDLSQTYYNQIKNMSLKEYFDLGVFSYDLMHFSSYGNSYMADFLIPEILKILPP